MGEKEREKGRNGSHLTPHTLHLSPLRHHEARPTRRVHGRRRGKAKTVASGEADEVRAPRHGARRHLLREVDGRWPDGAGAGGSGRVRVRQARTELAPRDACVAARLALVPFVKLQPFVERLGEGGVRLRVRGVVFGGI